MKQNICKSRTLTIFLLLLTSTIVFPQTITINAGSNQIINWEETHSAHLKGIISPGSIKTEWTCPQNSEVVFKNPAETNTEVTFP